jgi:DNA-binding CsgD family transcriptional regulator
MNNFFNEIKTEQKGSYYLVVLSLLMLLDGIKWFVYIENIGLYVSFNNIFLTINIVLLILLTLFGSSTKLKAPVFLLKLLDKSVNNITEPLNGNGITLYHKIGKKNKYFLTERECEVLKLIGKGLTNKEIAEDLFISIKTVEYHKYVIKQKIGCSKRKPIVEFLNSLDFIS